MIENVLSVVIPVYNKRSYVARPIRSVLTQTHKSYETIVVDNGSTYGSDEVVQTFADPHILPLKKQNPGRRSARNVGICQSKYEYIAFLDADDEWHPSYLQSIAAAINCYVDHQIGIYTVISDRRNSDYTLPALPVCRSGVD